MQVDISFDFAKVYNIEKADVVIGQKFSLFSDATTQTQWFSNNDSVLSLKVIGNNADAEATELGDSIILIMDASFAIQKQLSIRVVDAIVPMATDLGLTASLPIPK